jgi:hypothetical protein
MSYAPLHRPDTIAWKSVRYLETLPKGAEILCSKLAEAIGVDTKLIQPSMLAAVAAGQVFRRQKDDHARSPWWYSLTDYSKIPRAPVQRILIPETPPKGANRAASAGQSHGAAGSESPNGRGTNGAPALGAAPVFSSALLDGRRQHVLKAEAARPDATDRACAVTTPRGGAMGPGQPAAAGPVDGTIELHMVVRVTQAQAEAIVQLLGRTA